MSNTGSSNSNEPLSWGLWVIIVFHLVNLVLWFLGQTGAVFWMHAAIAWGLQDPMTENAPAIVQTNRAVGLADTLIALPLYAAAAYGLWRRQFYGAIVSWMIFYHSLYWPMMYWWSCFFYRRADIPHTAVSLPTILLPGVIWCFAVWGSWHLCRKEKCLLLWWQAEQAESYQALP